MSVFLFLEIVLESQKRIGIIPITGLGRRNGYATDLGQNAITKIDEKQNQITLNTGNSRISFPSSYIPSKQLTKTAHPDDDPADILEGSKGFLTSPLDAVKLPPL